LSGFTSEERTQLLELLLRIDANLERSLIDRDNG
jgi:hypothetical protein